MKKKTEQLLLALGIMPNRNGFYYICDAVALYAEAAGPISITKEIYPAVAAKYGTTSKCVDRAMRHAILMLGDIVPWDDVISILGIPPSGSTGTYKNSEFIALCALKVEE